MPAERGEPSTYEEAIVESHGASAFDMIPLSFYQFGNWMNHAQYERYAKKLEESGGFDVSGCTGSVANGIVEMNDTEIEDTVVPAAKFAVNKHNQDTGATLKFVEIARANLQILRDVIYYITLKAVDEQNQDQPKLYRAKVLKHPIDKQRGQTEADRKYTLESFIISPQQKLKKAPPLRVKPKSNKPKRSFPDPIRKPRRPFYLFVQELRTYVEHADKPFYELLNFAKTEWESLSREDKAIYAKVAEKKLLLNELEV